jgi:phosphoglycolate phosphatase
MIIFDWDGTLCDSERQIVCAVQEAARERGLPVPSDAAAADIIGLGLPQAMAVLFPQLSVVERAAVESGYSARYVASESEPPQLFPGAVETLEELKARGFELAVATGKSRRGLNRILGLLGLGDFFHATRCADETRSKPDPLMIEELIAERQASTEGVFMVGDTEYDLAMASSAGVASIGVSFGVHSPERLAAHRPVAIVDALPQLLDLPQLAAAAARA